MVNFPNITLKTAFYISAVSSIITGHFPPSSNKHGVKFFAAYKATDFPVTVDPVKQIISKGSLLMVLAT